MSETTPEDYLIILCEFLVDNKVHVTSSSIRVQGNCPKVWVNCMRASVKLHLSCTVVIQYNDQWHMYVLCGTEFLL